MSTVSNEIHAWLTARVESQGFERLKPGDEVAKIVKEAFARSQKIRKRVTA